MQEVVMSAGFGSLSCPTPESWLFWFSTCPVVPLADDRVSDEGCALDRSRKRELPPLQRVRVGTHATHSPTPRARLGVAGP